MQKISRIDQIGLNGNDGLHYDAKEECKHAWVFYYSMNYRQCIDCKRTLPINKSQNITTYKRKSTIEKVKEG